MTTKQIQAARDAYRLLLAFSGERAEDFRFHVRGLIEEVRDGEGEGEPTPGEWVSCAREYAWMAGTKSGKDKAAEARFFALDLRVGKMLAAAE